jgi:hypothetical protein
LYIRGDEDPTDLYNAVDGAEILEGSLHIDSGACLYFWASPNFPTLYSLLDNVLSSVKEVRGYVRVRSKQGPVRPAWNAATADSMISPLTVLCIPFPCAD